MIPNYTDTEYITPQPKRSNHFRKTYKLNQRFVVQFSGRMGYSQGLETVVEAWKMLSDLPNIRLMLVGNGQARPMLQDALGNDDRVLMLPVNLGRIYRLCSLQLMSDSPLRHGMAGTSVPGKIFGIMAAAHPVIAGVT